MNEEWRKIPGWPDYYEVSSLGRVRSLDHTVPVATGGEQRVRGRIFSGCDNGNGYIRLTLARQKVYLHHLVATAFHGPRPDGQEIRHLNGNPKDNRPENLAWGTSQENKHDILRHGNHRNVQKTHCPRGHEYDYNYLDGRRGCRTCIRMNSALLRTHCQRGHEFTSENTKCTRNGKRRDCRTCLNARRAARCR